LDIGVGPGVDITGMVKSAVRKDVKMAFLILLVTILAKIFMKILLVNRGILKIYKIFFLHKFQK